MNKTVSHGLAGKRSGVRIQTAAVLTCLGVAVLLVFSVCGTALAGEVAQPEPRNLDDSSLMRQCFALARASVEKGNQPFGSLLVVDGRVIMRSENTTRSDNNVTHHAETNLLAAVFRKYGLKTLQGATLYTSAEPCPMCCGAIYMAGIARVVYGLSTERLAAISGFKEGFPSRAVFALGDRKVMVSGPVLEKEAAAILEDYFKKQ